MSMNGYTKIVNVCIYTRPLFKPPYTDTTTEKFIGDNCVGWL